MIKKVNRKQLSDWMAGYIAGMIDGEGTIRSRPSRKDVRIYNNNFEMLSIVQVFSGGRISKNKDGLVLNYRKEEQRWLLPQIIPYLIIKKQKAIDLLKIL